MISVYLSNETNFNNNGLAVLEPSSCEIALTINGAWVLKLVHPFDNEGKYKYLEFVQENQGQRGNIIKVTDITALRDCDSTQLFRIYNSVKSLSDITVTAFPVGMEATYDAIIEELKLEDKTGKQVGTALDALVPNKYTLTVSSSLTKKRSVEYKNTNLIAALCGSDEGSFVNKFQAEVAYNNYEIKVKKRLGTTTNHDVRIGKNLTGLTYDIDDSAVVTRLYPISQDGLRLYDKTDMRYLPPLSPDRYIDSEDHWEDYPFTRAAFVEVPYSLVDTDTDAEVKTKTITHTAAAFTAIFEAVYSLMADFWADIVNNNEFDYSGSPYSFTIDAVPEFIQSVIGDISTTIAEKVLGSEATDSIYITQPSLRNWLTSAIKAAIEWIKDEELQEPEWVENQDGSYSYGTSSRLLTSEWGDIDNKMSYFGADTKWQKEKDDPFDWAWVQKKGQAKKYGNNKRYLARNTYVYDYDGECKYYWFDEEGWWDGTSETSGWGWHQDSTGWWFGDADPDGDDTKYIHDDWAFIRETSSSPRKLYYFDSDGYLDDSKTETVDWDWHKVNGRWYFGSTSKDSRATYLTDQWMKIDGDWYHFDSNGYVFDLEQAKLQYANDLAVYIVQEAEDTFTAVQDDLYDVLYENMEEYCSDLYANGLDLPAISVTVDFVDLSKTAEYTNYSNLERVCLGDDVIVHDEVHGIDSIEERVMGLTYDCLKGCNTQISVGGTTSVTSLFDTSVKGTGNEQRLVAGKNVTISNGVINVESETGDIYAGDQVSVQQLTSSGTAIARIYVNGTPTTLYTVGTDVSVNPIKQSGEKIATITVGGTTYDIYASTGLEHWVETQTDIYRTGTHSETTFDSDYYFDTQITWQTRSSHSYHGHWDFKKANTIPAYIGKVATGEDVGFILVSENEDGVDWLVNDVSYEPTGYGEPPQGEYSADYKHTGNFTYKNKTYYYSFGRYYYDTPHWETDSFSNVPNVDISSSYVNMAKALIDATEVTTTTPDIFGISNNPNSDKILWYSKNGTYASHTDDVYLTKEGVLNVSEIKIDGESVGALYKTRLYLGSSYSASINLSESYTGYDFLLIETYNNDDKNNLASMVSVADLTTGSYIGVNGYLMYTITNGRTLTFHEAPNDNNHSRFVKSIYGLRAGHDSGTAPTLEDVIVDGVSVVSGGVATINNKQDKLTAGTNIQIGADGKTISATDTTYSDFAGSGHGLVPAASSGDDTKFLKGDGSWDTPSGGTTYTAGTNIQISQQNVISATDTTYSDFAGSTHGLVPAVTTQSGKFLKDDGSWDTPSGGGSEIETEILTDISNNYHLYANQYAQIVYSSDELTFNSDTGSDDARAFIDYEYAISSSVKKIKVTIDATTKESSLTTDLYKICIGVKNTLSHNVPSPSDSDFIAKTLIDSPTSGAEVVELTFTSSSDVYLYIIANAWDATITSIKLVEYGSGGASVLDDLTDVDISSPTNGQVLTYDSTNQEWVNANPSSGGTFIETTPADYALLPSAQKSDATKLYFLKDNGAVETDTDVVVGSFTNFSEGAVTISVNSSGKLQYVWGGGSAIGAESVYRVAIPANVQKIKFKITTGSAYSASNPAWQVCVGIKDHEDLINWAYPTDADFLAKKVFAVTDSVFEDEIDCSNIAVNSYLYIVAHGWTMTVDYLKLTTYQNVFATKLMYKDTPYAAIKGMESDDYDALSSAEKSNGTVYFVTPSGAGSNKIYFMGEEF